MKKNIKFCREKEALPIKYTNVTVPTKNQLEDLLTDKLFDKANFVGVIYMEDLSDEFLRQDNMLDKTETMGNPDVKKRFATRLSADLLQLYIDLSKFYDYPISFENYYDYDCIEPEVEDLLVQCCNELETYSDKRATMKKFLSLIIKYASLFNLSFQDVRDEQIKIEKEEGNFYNGKLIEL